MTGDGASTISGLSVASSSSSRRFRLFGFGKRRYKKNGIVGETFDAPPPTQEDETAENLDYGYGYENADVADYEQAPLNGHKHFEPVMEVENSSDFRIRNEDEVYNDPQFEHDEEESNKGYASSAASDSISALPRQDASHRSSASSSTAQQQNEDDSTQSQSDDDEEHLPAPESTAPRNNKQQVSKRPSSAPRIPDLEPQVNLRIMIPRKRRRKPPTPYSMLTRSRFFLNMIDQAFDAVDTDRSGFVDESQLYNAILLVHLKLGMVAGQAACRPIPRERCHAIFEKFDLEERGCLNKEEFGKVMILMFSNVLFRVVIQWSMTILLVPIFAREVLDGMNWVKDTATKLRERNWLFALFYKLIVWLFFRVVLMLPAGILMLLDACKDVLDMVPGRVWNAVPLTLLTTLLGILAIPLLLVKLDSFTQWLADRRHSKKLQRMNIVQG